MVLGNRHPVKRQLFRRSVDFFVAASTFLDACRCVNGLPVGLRNREGEFSSCDKPKAYRTFVRVAARSEEACASAIRGTVLETDRHMHISRDFAPNDHVYEELAAQVTRIYQRAQNETLALLQSRPTEKVIPESRECMSTTQLAEYWQLYNDKIERTTAGILKWSKRPADQFPLPHAYMGDLLRFNRVEVDVWAKEEAERRRAYNEKRRLKIA